MSAFPEDIFDTVDQQLKSNQDVSVATTARSVKIAGSRLKHQMTLQLLTDDLVALCDSNNIEVKKNSLEALTSIIHSNWSSMKTQLKPKVGLILEFALKETKIRPELIQEVDLGPFKHKVDNGLPMRKAAFQLLETLQERAMESIDLSMVVATIVNQGLSDTAEECVVLNLNILAKMCQNSVAVVVSQLD